jgi:hypothetical protein
MAHIVLLGDSIFDNRSYTEGGPDVITQVRQLLPQGSQASLLAVDGATVQDVLPQLQRVPRDATHLVMSAGGNDALMNAGILDRLVSSTAQALEVFSTIARDFEAKYCRVVAACREFRLPLTICTIYNGCFPVADYQRAISTALMVFNDVILRAGIEFGLTMIDLLSAARLTTTPTRLNPLPSVGRRLRVALFLSQSVGDLWAPGSSPPNLA